MATDRASAARFVPIRAAWTRSQVMVSAAGAPLLGLRTAGREFPNLDVTIRGAI